MYNYKFEISYNGSNYSGFQYQVDNPNTVQEVIESEVKKIINFQRFSLVVASRTDKGVHANGQVLKVCLPKYVEPLNLTKGLNSKLPQDIRINNIEECEEKFFPNQDAKSKEYHYYFSLNKDSGVFNTLKFFDLDLDIEKMQKACHLFIGEHDFKSFHIAGNRRGSTVREIFECNIEKIESGFYIGPVYRFRIIGSGFLKYMVRMMMDSLIRVGLGEISMADLNKLLSSNSEIKLSRVDACGLHLVKINY